MSSDLTSELMKVAIEAAPRLRAELDGAILDLKTSFPDLASRASEVSKHLGATLADVGAGKISPADGREAAVRDLGALELLAATAKERAAAIAYLRAKAALKIALEVGLTLAGVAARGLV